MSCSESDFILDVAEEAGIEIESSCRSGTCGTCVQKLAQGDVRYDGEPEALSDSERQEGMILTCIACPTGQVVVDL
ncbi:MAG: 2Fe-2S iron-sulfur cluster-binding protein [Microcoleaceae cyanobacterium]